MRRSASTIAEWKLGTGITASHSAVARRSTASASDQRPSSQSSVACRLSQWLLRKIGPGAEPIRPWRRSSPVQVSARSRSAV